MSKECAELGKATGVGVIEPHLESKRDNSRFAQF